MTLVQNHEHKYSRFLIFTFFYTRENHNCKCTTNASKYLCSQSFPWVQTGCFPYFHLSFSKVTCCSAYNSGAFCVKNLTCSVMPLSSFIFKRKQSLRIYHLFNEDTLTEISCEHIHVLTITGPYLNT